MRVTVTDFEAASNALLSHQKRCGDEADSLKPAALSQPGMTEKILKFAVAGVPIGERMFSDAVTRYLDARKEAVSAGKLAYRLDGLAKAGVSLVELDGRDAELLAAAGLNL